MCSTCSSNRSAPDEEDLPASVKCAHFGSADPESEGSECTVGRRMGVLQNELAHSHAVVALSLTYAAHNGGAGQSETLLQTNDL
jgi:hypothetical protein